MLRRDVEYVLTWNPQTFAWMARPVRCDGDQIVRAGSGHVDVDVVAWVGRPLLPKPGE